MCMGMSVLVLIRKSRDAEASLIIREHLVPLERVLMYYRRLYKRVLAYSDGSLVATLEEVTGDYTKVIGNLNKSFGTNSALFEHTDDNLSNVFCSLRKWIKKTQDRTILLKQCRRDHRISEKK